MGKQDEKLQILNSVNKELLEKTGIDFLNQLTDMANNEKKTEFDCHRFIKANYPVKTGLTAHDHYVLSLLLRFYLQKVEEHDAGEDNVLYCKCQPIENGYDKPFRSRSLYNFLNKQKDPTLVTGFFEKD